MNCYSLLILLVPMAVWQLQNPLKAEQNLYIGTNAAEQGIFASTLDIETGKFSPPRAVGDAPRPGFLALHPTLPRLYAITHEQSTPSGGVRVFEIEEGTTNLNLLGKQSSGDEGTTHLAIDLQGNAIVLANYTGGSTSLLPLTKDGAVGAMTALVKHTGSSVNRQRQDKPYAHGIAIDGKGQFACVADLGADQVIVYRLYDGKRLERIAHWEAKPGAGPRHLAFHPNGRWLYCINELDSTLTALAFDADTGELSELQTIGTLPADFDAANTTAEVVVHPSGRFVYISNRGHDSTAAFAIDFETGSLSLIEFEPTLGGHPRFIGIEPSGRMLIAANRDANNLVSFWIDAHTGELAATGHQASVPQPVCVVFPVQNQ